MTVTYAHTESNELASSFRALDARASRLVGLESAMRYLVTYIHDTEERDVFRAALAELIAAEKRAPRPMGLPVRPVAPKRTRQPRKAAPRKASRSRATVAA